MSNQTPKKIKKETTCFPIFSKLDLHDSNIVQLSYFEHKLLVTLELCNWRQRDYVKGEPEILKKQFQFDLIDDFECDDIDQEYMSCYGLEILSVEIDLYQITFICSDGIIVRIKANNVIELNQE